MRWSDLPLSPPPRTLRQFGGLWLLFFLALAGWQGYLRDNAVLGWVLLAVAVVGGAAGLIYPLALRPVFVAALIVTFPIGWVVSQLMLAVLFYLVFTPLGLVFRLFGRDALQLRKPADATTYWTVKPAAVDVRAYFNQY